MERLGYLVALTVLAVLVPAPVALAQNNPPSCGDFPFQAAAQAYLRANLNASSSLDENNSGVACKTYPYPPKSPREEDPIVQLSRPQIVEQDAIKETPPLPQSGGPWDGAMLVSSVTLISGLLLLISGLLTFRYTRRIPRKLSRE